jgi:hypothetical protein
VKERKEKSLNCNQGSIPCAIRNCNLFCETISGVSRCIGWTVRSDCSYPFVAVLVLLKENTYEHFRLLVHSSPICVIFTIFAIRTVSTKVLNAADHSNDGLNIMSDPDPEKEAMRAELEELRRERAAPSARTGQHLAFSGRPGQGWTRNPDGSTASGPTTPYTQNGPGSSSGDFRSYGPEQGWEEDSRTGRMRPRSASTAALHGDGHFPFGQRGRLSSDGSYSYSSNDGDYSSDARGGRRGRNRNRNRRGQSAAPDYGGSGGPLGGGCGDGDGGACHTMHNPNFHNNEQPTQPFRNDRSRSSRGSGRGGNGGARREEQPRPRQPQITIYDPAEHRYARRDEWIMKKK